MTRVSSASTISAFWSTISRMARWHGIRVNGSYEALSARQPRERVDLVRTLYGSVAASIVFYISIPLLLTVSPLAVETPRSGGTSRGTARHTHIILSSNDAPGRIRTFNLAVKSRLL